MASISIKQVQENLITAANPGYIKIFSNLNDNGLLYYVDDSGVPLSIGDGQYGTNIIGSTSSYSMDFSTSVGLNYYGVLDIPSSECLIELTEGSIEDGKILIIKDEDGISSTKNIIIQSDDWSTGVTIDGATNSVISTDYGSVSLLRRDGNWFSISSGGAGGSGSSGTSGISGSSGTSGVGGSSGTSGANGSSGTSGVDGSGSSGTSGISGSSGTSGADGNFLGSSGTSGVDGSSGTSGVDGSSGTSGANGSSGTSGTSGISGSSGTSGANGSSGTSGANGSSGTSGANGSSGSSGTSGVNGASVARNYSVSNSGASAYTIDGSSNPTLNLLRGFTYTFSVSASGHPFWIQTTSGAYSAGNVYNTGITNNGAQSGTITITLPYNAPSTLYYVCQYHSSMQGTISITDVSVGTSGTSGTSGSSGTSGLNGLTNANNIVEAFSIPTPGADECYYLKVCYNATTLQWTLSYELEP